MSRNELLQTIQDIENGLAMNPTGEILERLTNRLERAKKNLAALDEKKSNQQPTGKTGELPEPAMTGYIPTVERDLKSKATDQEQSEKATENQGWQQIEQVLTTAPQVAPKPTAIIHFAGQQYPVHCTRGDLRDIARQNFTLVVKSVTFGRCLKSGDFSELWTLRLYYNLYLAVQGLRKMEGVEEYKMEDLFIRWHSYGEEKQEAGRVLAEYLKRPKPE